MSSPEPLVCAGRDVDHETLTSVGEPCGRRFRPKGWDVTAEEAAEQAWAAGWSVSGPLPMCPRCRRPAALREVSPTTCGR